MAFNIKDVDKEPNEQQEIPQPILYNKKSGGSVRNILIIIFAVVVLLGLVGFILYKSGMFKEKKPSPSIVELPMITTDTITPPPEAEIETKVPVTETKPTPKTEINEQLKHPRQQQPQISQSVNGRYTIYVGSHKSKSVAEKEIIKWSNAGYQASIIQYNEWYRISLGRYATREEAKRAAEQSIEAFPDGYWIGPIP